MNNLQFVDKVRTIGLFSHFTALDFAWIGESGFFNNIYLFYLFIFKIHQACINVYNKFFKDSLYCQPETTKRVVSCFSRLMYLVNEQLSILEFIYSRYM